MLKVILLISLVHHHPSLSNLDELPALDTGPPDPRRHAPSYPASSCLGSFFYCMHDHTEQAADYHRSTCQRAARSATAAERDLFLHLEISMVSLPGMWH
ncbi:hypothetical protein GE09DRAFT_461545 [Coniochaeta sp. 2T2.1]|nr:hypothetical protein GE09DRAFT_461545 [Coniochaeta sp. 2T2.1]